MSNGQGPGRDHDGVPSRLYAFNAFMRRVPTWAYLSVVFSIGVVGAAVYVLATRP